LFVEGEPALRAALERCAALPGTPGGRDWVEALATREDVASDDMEFVQPALFALQVGLAALLAEWGVRPAAVVGHSLGEVAAAHVAGALSLEDAWRVVRARARLMRQGLDAVDDPGGMLALRADVDSARALMAEIGGGLGLAAHNGPRLVVVSGPRAALASLQRRCAERRIAARAVRVPGAGHGPELPRLARELRATLEGLRPQEARVELLSTVTGARARGPELDAAYWGRNLAEPVLFAEAAAALADRGPLVFLELGRQPTLEGALTELLAERQPAGLALTALRRDGDPRESLLRALGELYVRGLQPRFEGLRARPGRWVDLPPFPWRRQRFWFGPAPWQAAFPRHLGGGDGQALGRPLRPAFLAGTWLWQIELDAARGPWAQHTLEELPLVPPAQVLAWLSAAGEAARPDERLAYTDLRLTRPLLLPRQGTCEVQVSWHEGDAGRAEILVHVCLPGSEPELCARAQVQPAVAGDSGGAWDMAGPPSEQLRASGVAALIAPGGLRLSPELQVVDAAERAPGRCRARPGPSGTRSLFERCELALRAAQLARGGEALLWPTALGTLVCAPGDGPVDARVSPQPGGALLVDVRSDDRTLELRGVRFEHLARQVLEAAPLDWLYDVVWEERPRAAGQRRAARFVLLGDHAGVRAALARRLRDAGCEVALADVPGVGEAAASLPGAWASPDVALVFLDALTAPPAGELTLAGLALAQERGCVMALRLARALARTPAGARPRLWLVTRGAQALPERPAPLGLAQAPLWGFGRSLAAELRDAWGGLVDLDPAAALADQVETLSWALTDAGAEEQVAFVGARPYVPRLVRRDPGPPAGALPAWSDDGYYLVTGGLGDLGLVAARWLAERGARRLALVGRTPLPPREEWPRVEAASPLVARLAAVRACEAAGAQVACVAADVADEDALRAALQRLRGEWGPVRGVLHLAGSAHPGPLADVQEEHLLADLRAKVLGSFVLETLLEREPLDFHVSFSSGAAVLGSPFLAGYAAGNAFLDALAHWRAARGKPGLAIGWGFWEEGGLAARGRRELTREAAPTGLLGFGHASGLRLLEYLMRQPAPHALAIHYDWGEWSAAHPGAAAPLLERLFVAAASRREPGGVGLGERRARVLAAPPERRAAEIEAWLRELVGRALGRAPEAVDVARPLTHLGLDSLMAIELKDRIELELGVALPVVDLLIGPSLAEIAQRLAVQVTQPTGAAVTQASVGLEDPAALLRQLDDLPEARVDELLRALGAGE
jgi:myxalamid-type polyketide synthase MxaE and MxaD